MPAVREVGTLHYNGRWPLTLSVLPMDQPLLDDPFIAAQIDQAVEPLVGKVSAKELAWLRASLATLIEEDPAAAKALVGAYPRQVDESGERIRPPVRQAGTADEGQHGSGSA